MLFNIQEMSCTDHAKFGNGIIKEGEEESVRVKLQIMNETGCRSILPFDGMLAADAYLWAKFIDDKKLQDRLVRITQNSFDNRRGFYGTIGSGCVIKNSWILKDVKVGNCCYIKGASKLKNVTINSSDKEPTQIGENVVLVNGIVGYGCRIFYSCIAVKFVLGSHSNLKYGARLIDSFMGDNSTISCCEVLNNLIFPAHEQHHNNSFLIASVIMGQSNLAAGATIGSNHNSRTNDNEIVAGRGFWPGLCTSVKHSCKFASYTMLAKADYQYELINPFPFALLSNDAKNDELTVMPAFSWMYNMYALARNNWKFANRDQRIFKVQNIDYCIIVLYNIFAYKDGKVVMYKLLKQEITNFPIVLKEYLINNFFPNYKKYLNKKVTVDGVTYDSIKEYNRYVRKFPTRFFLSMTGYEMIEYDYLNYNTSSDAPTDLFGE